MDFWEDMKIPQCFAYNKCPAYNTEHCIYTCYSYHNLQKLIKNSDLPMEFQFDKDLKVSTDDVNYETFVWLKQNYQSCIKTRIQSGHGLYLWGREKGTGKTTWATKLMLAYFREIGFDHDVERSRGLYINVTEFLELTKDGFNDSNTNDSVLVLKDRLRRADVVIWDDIGTERPTEYAKSILYTYINNRYANRKTNIFTSNYSLDELSDRLKDARVTDRINGTCRQIEFLGTSKRGENAWWNIK